MKEFFIGDAAKFENKSIETFFVLAQIQKRERKQGGAYLALQLADKTGTFDGRMWDGFDEALKECGADM